MKKFFQWSSFAGMLSSPVAVTNAETPDAASEYQNDEA
jgi:hypothetical protein